MRILIVKLSSLGDVIHALPVVQDARRAFPDVIVDWAVEPGFAPLVRRARGIGDVIEVPLRQWMRRWWAADVRREVGAWRKRLRRHRYDAIIDLQGLTKSAIVARLAIGRRYAIANRTDGSSHEAPTRWLAHRAIHVEPHIHALDRSRVIVAEALGYAVTGTPDYGLRAPDVHADAVPPSRRTVAFLHGTSRDDKLWPEAQWIALGQQFIAEGWRIVLPQGNSAERARAERIARALGPQVEVWPPMSLALLMDKMSACQGAIGVDSGLSHLAVALDLPHVQIYNFPTAWRTGPLVSHGHRHQRSVEAMPTPSLLEVSRAWRQAWSAWEEQRPSVDDIHAATQAMSCAPELPDDGAIDPSSIATGQPPASSVA